MKAWKHIGSTETIDIGCRVMQHKTFQKNDGNNVVANIAGKDGLQAAFVIALTPDRKVIIARQFRCGPEKVLDELPGGLVDPGETPRIAAERELREEVGYSSEDFEEIGVSYTDAWDTLTRYYYLARNCYKVESINPDEDEEIEVDIITINQLFENARNMGMIDVQALFFAYDKLKQMEDKYATTN